MSGLDERLQTAGLGATAEELIDIWSDHRPAKLPVPLACPHCGFLYAADAPYCPTTALIRHVLRRRNQFWGVPYAREHLTELQFDDLYRDRTPSTALPTDNDRPLPPRVSSPAEQLDIFATPQGDTR